MLPLVRTDESQWTRHCRTEVSAAGKLSTACEPADAGKSPVEVSAAEPRAAGEPLSEESAAELAEASATEPCAAAEAELAEASATELCAAAVAQVEEHLVVCTPP